MWLDAVPQVFGTGKRLGWLALSVSHHGRGKGSFSPLRAYKDRKHAQARPSSFEKHAP